MKSRRMKKCRRKSRKNRNQRGGLFGFGTKPVKEPEVLVPIKALPGAYGWSCQDSKMTDFGNSKRYNSQEAMNADIISNDSNWCNTLTPEVIEKIKAAAQHLENPESVNVEFNAGSNAGTGSIVSTLSNAGTGSTGSEHSASSRNTATSILRDFSNPVNNNTEKRRKIFFRIGQYLLDKGIMDAAGNINTRIKDPHNFVDKFLQLNKELYA
jgi:hypothetical protein